MIRLRSHFGFSSGYTLFLIGKRWLGILLYWIFHCGTTVFFCIHNAMFLVYIRYFHILCQVPVDSLPLLQKVLLLFLVELLFLLLQLYTQYSQFYFLKKRIIYS